MYFFIPSIGSSAYVDKQINISKIKTDVLTSE